MPLVFAVMSLGGESWLGEVTWNSPSLQPESSLKAATCPGNSDNEEFYLLSPDRKVVTSFSSSCVWIGFGR